MGEFLSNINVCVNQMLLMGKCQCFVLFFFLLRLLLFWLSCSPSIPAFLMFLLSICAVDISGPEGRTLACPYGPTPDILAYFLEMRIRFKHLASVRSNFNRTFWIFVCLHNLLRILLQGANTSEVDCRCASTTWF